MTQVWTVHVVKSNGATFAEVVFDAAGAAGDYARTRSGDAGVRAAAVTRFTVGELGTRTTAIWYERGIPTDGRP